MYKLGKWSIKNNVTVNLIMVFIIMAGLFTVMNMRREMFPQFSLDMIVVTVPYPGASPEEVEGCEEVRQRKEVCGKTR